MKEHRTLFRLILEISTVQITESGGKAMCGDSVCGGCVNCEELGIIDFQNLGI